MKRIYLVLCILLSLLVSSRSSYGQQSGLIIIPIAHQNNPIPDTQHVSVPAKRSPQNKKQLRTKGCALDSIKFTEHNVTNCSGTPCDGSVSVDLVYGLGLSGNYTYLWSPGGETTSSINGLCASQGTLSVNVSDANGCNITQPINVYKGKGNGKDTTVFSIAIYPLEGTAASYWVCDGQCFDVWLANQKDPNQVGVPDTSTYGGPYDFQWSGLASANNGPGKFHDCASAASPPNYCITITDAACGTTNRCFTIPVRAKPLVTVTAPANPTCGNTCDGQATANPFGGTVPYSYAWDNGATTQVNNTLCGGPYNVTITDKNQCSSSSAGGTLTAPTPIVPVVSTTKSNCAGLLGTASVNSVTGGTPGAGGYTYSWNTTPVQTTAGITNLKEGPYVVTVSDSKGCNDKDTVIVTGGGPYTLAAINNAMICAGQTDTLTALPLGGDAKFTYSWNPGGLTDSSIIVKPGATTSYTVTVLDSNGCMATQNATVTVNPLPIVTLTPTNTNACKGDKIQLNAGGGATYSWSPSAELDNGGIPNPIATVQTTNTYTVTVTTGQGCIDSASVMLTAVQPPIANAGGGGDICTGQSLQLNASGGTSYSWLPTAGLTNPNISNPGASPVGTTTYTVTVNTSAPCPSSTDMATVVVHFVPTITAGPDTTIFAGKEVGLYVNGGGPNYTWTPQSGLSCYNCPNPMAEPLETTTYIVSMTDGFGCRAMDTVVIKVDDTLTLFAPNAFTPQNKDGLNDVFNVYGIGIYNFEFYIFNRWGDTLFETNDPSLGWDGTYHGSVVKNDVYVWLAKATSITGKTLSKTGSVTVIK